MHNFNHIPFVDYLINKIISETNKEDYLEGRLEILFDHHKKYSQLVMRKELSFDSGVPNVKEQMLCWINEELKQCKRRLQKSPPNQSAIPFNKTGQFSTNLSVPQLSCFFKGLEMSGIVTFESDTVMFKVVADNFITPHTKNISAESLYNKQYDIDPRTKDSVKKMLSNAIKSIDEL